MSRFPSASSPFTAASSEGHPSSPFTPSPSARARNGGSVNHSPEQSQSSSTTFSESLNPNTNRMDDITRSTFRNIFTSTSTTPGRHIIIRSDPSLLTCFDPQDKQLYDLWAPQK